MSVLQTWVWHGSPEVTGPEKQIFGFALAGMALEVLKGLFPLSFGLEDVEILQLWF